MVVVFDNVSFFGSNIPNELEQVMSYTDKYIDESFENEDQKNAYHLGVQNTLSILRQILDYELEQKSVTFYYPDTDTREEMSFEELVAWMRDL